MTGRTLLLLRSFERILLPAAAYVGLASPILLFLLCAAQVHSQSQAAEATIRLPEFEAASVSYSNVSLRHRAEISANPGGEVRAESLTLGALMWFAFDVQPFQIVGGPAWIHKDLFDVVARPPASAQSIGLNRASPASPLSEEQRLMLQSLLIARFHLEFHLEFKTGPIYVLEKAPGKPKLHPSRTRTLPPGLEAMWEPESMGMALQGRTCRSRCWPSA